jgi:hypothetical protein
MRWGFKEGSLRGQRGASDAAEIKPRYAASIAAMAFSCLPCNARNAVATAAIAANRHADKKT